MGRRSPQVGRVTTRAVRLGAQEDRAEGREDSEARGAPPKPGFPRRPVMGCGGGRGLQGSGGMGSKTP